MKLKIFKALWGMEGILEEQFERIAQSKYDGIESGLPHPNDAKKFGKLLKQYKLDYIAMVFTAGDNHTQSFINQYREAVQWNPLLVNSHSAKDSMSLDDQKQFFESALTWEKKLGIPVGHETHRGRAFYTPWSTAAILREFPELKITADFSHWCNVCESMLNDQSENLKLACQRTVHIHARVGHEEGPQVSDPRAPELESYLRRHEQWWDMIYQNRKKQGAKWITFDPEFGPPYYQQALPYTLQPVANLWDVCLWMSQRIRKRYSE